MADNTTTQSATPATLPASTTVATVEASFSGDTAHAGVGVLAKSSGSEGSRTLTLINPATEDKQDAEATLIGAVTETAPATDTASSGLNGRLQRIAQRLTSLIALLPTALGSGGGLKVDGSGTALPVSAASLPLPSGASTSALQGAGLPAALGAGGGLKIDGSGTALPVSQSGTWTVLVGPSVAAGVTQSRVANSASSVTALAANSSRKAAEFSNDSTVNVYVGKTSPVTSTDYWFKLFPSQAYALPTPIYQGALYAIADSASGSLQIAEII